MADVLFEVSSEAGRKVGGIYTVLKTKSKYVMEKFDDSYILFGMYDSHSARDELDEETPPIHISKVLEALRAAGMNCHYGRWRNGNNARLILVDAWEFGKNTIDVPYGNKKDSQLNAIKYFLWKDYKIDSMFMSHDFNENVLWSYACGRLIEELLKCEEFKDKKVVAQFHEWISGAALLYLKYAKARLATVFTTHATVLGRSITAHGVNLMREIHEKLKEGKHVDYQEAYKYKLEGTFLLEKACAEQADVFTTVSDTVGSEVEYILGKKPDVITLNGINLEKEKDVPTLFKDQFLNRQALFELINAMFLPYSKINFSDVSLFYISSRYEFENKGIDILIDALGELNERLKNREQKKTVFAFIFVPSNVGEPLDGILENMLILDRIKDVLAHNKLESTDPSKAVYGTCEEARKKRITEVVDLFRNMNKFGPTPPVCCFNLNYGCDIILERLKANKLNNGIENPVKVIFYPAYLKPGDGLLNMNYTAVMNGCDVGVFPSRYEPWGYTPVEAASALNVAITTDSSGFGKFVMNNFKDLPNRGIKVLVTENKTERQIIVNLADMFENLMGTSNEKLIELKKDANKMIEICDWAVQIKHYFDAYDMAVERAKLCTKTNETM